ncbi:MAG: hypothetical protein EA402_10655 [Planctomycetota bacterium]|nr:MAG: hypothetical protein EA402_10655 [Planctomycetota bacterium]
MALSSHRLTVSACCSLGLIGLLLAMGCQRPGSVLAREELQLIAWYVEDVAHGQLRDPGELALLDGSDGVRRVAEWAWGSRSDGRLVRHPDPLAARRGRWALLAQGLGAGRIVYTQTGQLALAPQPRDPQAAVEDAAWQGTLRQAVELENRDRVATTSILLALSGVQEDEHRAPRLIAALQGARRDHAAAAGGQPWTPPTPAPSPSSSPGGLTPSTSPTPASPRRAP